MVMMYITSFGINVLIRPIVQDFGTSVGTLQLLIVAASLIAGSLMVTAGRLGDKFGRKKVFLVGAVLYTVGLIVVVLSPNTMVFGLGWGVIWPSGMVLIIPTSIAMIMYFYEGPQRAFAFGLYGAVLAAVSAIAPVVVGLLADQFGWRAALALSPAMGVVTILVTLTIPETDRDESIEIDVPSVLLSVLSFGTFLLGTTVAGRYGWFFEKRPFEVGGRTLETFGLSVVPYAYVLSIAFLLTFLRRGKRLSAVGKTPLLDASILRNRGYTLGMSIATALFLANAGLLFGVSVFLQAGVRMDSLQTALTTLPLTAALALVSLSTPNLSRLVDPKWIIAGGSVLTIVGIWLIAQGASMTMDPVDVLPGMLLAGLGAGLLMAQVVTVTMATVPPQQAGAASGLSETAKEIIGQGFAVAFSGAVLFTAMYGSMAETYATIENIEVTPEEHERMLVELEDIYQDISEAEEAAFVATLPAKTRGAYGDIVDTAGKAGLDAVLFAMAAVMGLCLLLSLALPKHDA